MAQSELSALYYELANLSAKLTALKAYAQKIDEKATRLGVMSLGLALSVDSSRVTVDQTISWLAGLVNASQIEAADYGFINESEDEE